ncbi:MAG: DUF4239 domain-containing protein [Candidatus Omnitrophica bacterium]|nr:DUF4239 domain-containing protein [Candidatus Omnitrophota bacterium]
MAEKKIKWLRDNWFDSIISIIVILSPILENLEGIFAAAPGLRLLRLSRLTRLTRLSRLLRFLRLLALGGKVKHSWKKLNLKIYVAFFFVLGTGFTASFLATGFQHTSIDTAWISLFVSIFGVFYAVLISFFVIHIWGKFNSIGSEIGKQVNALRNVYILIHHLPSEKIVTGFYSLLADYTNEVQKTLWEGNTSTEFINNKFLKLVYYFNDIKLITRADEIVLDNIIEELRISSVAQANLINLSSDKTPKILWILLLLLSTTLIGSFVFLGFQNQFLATILISLVSTVTGLVVALIFDIDTPFQAGFWKISAEPYQDLKKFIAMNK